MTLCPNLFALRSGTSEVGNSLFMPSWSPASQSIIFHVVLPYKFPVLTPSLRHGLVSVQTMVYFLLLILLIVVLVTTLTDSDSKPSSISKNSQSFLNHTHSLVPTPTPTSTPTSAFVPSSSSLSSNCFPSVGFQSPSTVPDSTDDWWCDPTTEYAFVGFSYEVTACRFVTFSHLST
jgi:hypothetical protein